MRSCVPRVSNELAISLRSQRRDANKKRVLKRSDQGVTVTLVSSELEISLRFLRRTQMNEYNMRSRCDACGWRTCDFATLHGETWKGTQKAVKV